MRKNNYNLTNLDSAPKILYSLLNNIPCSLINRRGIEIFIITCDNLAPHILDFYGLLSSDEVTRASMYISNHHKIRYICRQGFLRVLLGYYIQTAPSLIRFKYNEYGKPQISNRSIPLKIKFNLSHSNDLISYAISFKNDVGIDIEHIKPIKNIKRIVRDFFTEKENYSFCKLPKNRQLETFYKIWIQKEAITKALGIGLFNSIRRFSVGITPIIESETIHSLDIRKKPHKVSLTDMFYMEGYNSLLALVEVFCLECTPLEVD